MLESIWKSVLPYDLLYESQGTWSPRPQVGDISYIKEGSSYNEEQQPEYLEGSLPDTIKR